MANLRRRSARLSKVGNNPPSARKTPLPTTRLGSVVERDETPDTIPQSIDGVLATPNTSRTVQEQLSQLSALRTPQTEPKPEQADMDPKTVHRSTAKAPDSGLKLGFSDIRDKKNDTPSKTAPRQSIPTSSAFEFKFSSDSNLSKDAQKLMENVREDAARIKAQMVAEKAAQDQQDHQAEKMFGAGRKIAQPKGKAGRFSDVHMAQFKKMDSIENHASAYRARPGFAGPTTQSLKRSPSKAGLDELARPRSAGKDQSIQPRRITPPVIGRPNSVSPFKSIPVSVLRNTQGPSKRARQTENQDVSDVRPFSTTSRSMCSTVHSPTKSTLSQASQGNISPERSSMIPRSNSIRSVKPVTSLPAYQSSKSPAKPTLSKPLPPLPTESDQVSYPDLPPSPSKTPSVMARENSFQSKLPTLSGLRSILRGDRKQPTVAERPGTPKRPNTAGRDSGSPKKVDFTPSVKSRHAVKLATASPSPAKIRRDTPFKASEPVIPYDSSAYIIEDDGDQEWEDEDSGVSYPVLPSAEPADPLEDPFSTKSREHTRRDSREFKSIFTNLHPTKGNESTTLTTINTELNQTNPEIHVNRVVRSSGNTQPKPSPSTIRRVRSFRNTHLVQPFEDKVATVPHGLPGKKRRHESDYQDDKLSTDEDAKENRRMTMTPAVPGGWNDSAVGQSDDEGTRRAGKRMRTSTLPEKVVMEKGSKKPNVAREAAAKNAKERKGKGVLSLSRLNMLSRPKSRG